MSQHQPSKARIWIIVASLLLLQGAAVAYLLRGSGGEKGADTPTKNTVAAAPLAADGGGASATPVQPDAAAQNAPTPDIGVPAPDTLAPDTGAEKADAAVQEAPAPVVAAVRPVTARRKAPRGKPRAIRRPKGKERRETVQPATVSLACSPRARVFVDGQSTGFTPLSLSLTAGGHSIELRAEGHVRYSKRLNLAAGEKRTLEVVLKAVPKAAPAPAPAPKPVVAKKDPVAKPVPKAAPAAPRKIPTLKLPVSVRINLYTEEGQKARFGSMVLFAVERAVTRGIGLSARGTTGALLRYLYTQNKDEDAKVKLYPRTMGYFIAQALVKGKTGVGGMLLRAHRSGRIEKLANAGWKP